MRRWQGSSRGRRIPGLGAALAEYLGAFGAKWDSREHAEGAEDVRAGRPVEVSGQTIWRATFDARRPDEYDELMLDKGMYRVLGDQLEPVEP